MLVLSSSVFFVDTVCRQRIIPKSINVRIEHIQPSRCREDFLNRVKENANRWKIAKEKKEEVKIMFFLVSSSLTDTLIYYRFQVGCLKRQPVGPRPGHFVSTKKNKPVLVEPIPYEYIG